jgi:hypothetical protein
MSRVDEAHHNILVDHHRKIGSMYERLDRPQDYPDDEPYPGRNEILGGLKVDRFVDGLHDSLTSLYKRYRFLIPRWHFARGLSAAYTLLTRRSMDSTSGQRMVVPYACTPMQDELRLRSFGNLQHDIYCVPIIAAHYTGPFDIRNDTIRTDGHLAHTAHHFLPLARGEYKDLRKQYSSPYDSRAICDPAATVPKTGAHLIQQMLHLKASRHFLSSITANVMLAKMDSLMERLRVETEDGSERFRLVWSVKGMQGMWVVPEVALVDVP